MTGILQDHIFYKSNSMSQFRYHTVLPVSDLHVGDNFALIENLSAYTNYQVQVRSDDDEDASGVVFFSTSG